MPAESLRTMPCPFCGAAILFDDAQSSLLHTEPRCAAFDQVCERFGLRPRIVDPAAWRVGADGRAHRISAGKA